MEMKWTSLAEEMPEQDAYRRVLIYTEGTDFQGEQVFDVNTESLRDWFRESPEDRPEEIKAATHWMIHPADVGVGIQSQKIDSENGGAVFEIGIDKIEGLKVESETTNPHTFRISSEEYKKYYEERKLKEIVFTDEMEEAIIAGKKTMTRMLVDPQPVPVQQWDIGISRALYREGDFIWPSKVAGVTTVSCKPNGPEDWVEENSPYGKPGDLLVLDGMTIELVSLRVERLQTISAADAEAEGADCYSLMPDGGSMLSGYSFSEDDGKCLLHPTAAGAYREWWVTEHGAESWEANPWVWVIEFKLVELASVPF